MVGEGEVPPSHLFTTVKNMPLGRHQAEAVSLSTHITRCLMAPAHTGGCIQNSFPHLTKKLHYLKVGI